MKFEELDINEDLKKRIREIGYIELTPIQEKAIPYGLAGRDLTGLAQTGTGKTLSFLIPIINKLLTEDPEGPMTLVLAPTRELVMQISDEAKKILKNTNKKVATIIGGTDYREQEEDLQAKAAIVIATPGRLIDHIKAGKLDLGKLQFFVLDEADRMFDMGFIKDIRYLMKKCPENKQVMLFSATMSYYVLRLASDYLRDPVEISIEPDKIVTENIDQNLIHLGRDEKIPYLINSILNDKEEGLGIIFTNLKVLVPEIAAKLKRFGIPVTGISSMLDQKKRVRLLKDFKLGKHKYLVATDVASRGLDVENIKVVYNYDLPGDTENYVHRIGRTARAGKKGRSISFCSERDYKELEKIETYLGYKLPIMEVNEDYLKFPEGDFQPIEDEKEKHVHVPREHRDKNNRHKKTNTGRHNKPNFKDRKKERPEKRDPLDEAKLYLEKADSVLSTEKPKNNNPNNKTDKSQKHKPKNKTQHTHTPAPKHTREEKKDHKHKSYDKSKRNLFDINDIKKDENKSVSIWQRIRKFFKF